VGWSQNHWDGFLWFGLKTGGRGFPDTGLKTDNYGLVILASKSPRQFLGLALKIKQTTIYRLCHKIDGRAMVWDTCQDLVACFVRKQVWLRFPSLASRLVVMRRRVVHVAPSHRLRRVQPELMRWVASDPSTTESSFSMY
jgi:hypothetical protein